MYNNVFLIGRLVRDPDMRMTPSGVAVTRFTIAVDRPRSKDRESSADFIRVVAWRRLAEICGEYLTKGKLVAIEGRLQIDSFEKNGERRTFEEVVADNMQMLSRANAESDAVPAHTTPG
jgi:single-strand DNA-binding protein